MMNEETNPCMKEQNMVYKCFDRNDFDKEKCQLEMKNYKECKTFWYNVSAERRRKGVSPQLPPLREREQIKSDYFNQSPRNQ